MVLHLPVITARTHSESPNSSSVCRQRELASTEFLKSWQDQEVSLHVCMYDYTPCDCHQRKPEKSTGSPGSRVSDTKDEPGFPERPVRDLSCSRPWNYCLSGTRCQSFGLYLQRLLNTRPMSYLHPSTLVQQ